MSTRTTVSVITPPAPENPAEQARIKADVRKVLGVDSARNILGKALFAELFPEETNQPERLAKVIPFPVRAAGGAA